MDNENLNNRETNNNINYNVKSTKKNNMPLIICLIIIIVILLGIIVYLLFFNKSSVEDNAPTLDEKTIFNNIKVYEDKDEEKEDNKASQNLEYSFSYQNYNIKLINKIDNISDIYAINIRATEEKIDYELYAKYTDEKEVKIATITAKENTALEYRTLDIESNKLYFVIVSREYGTIYELNYIDLNDLSKGATSLDGFNKAFIEDNYWVVGGDKPDSIYSSQIFVKENYIYYTSFKEKKLKRYDMQIKKSEIVIDEEILWFDFTLDKINNRIFYSTYKENEKSKLFLCDLNGNQASEINNSLKSGSDFWTHAYYNNLPLFINGQGGMESYKAVFYTYDYSTKTFKKINDGFRFYEIKYNSIKELDEYKKESFINKTFYIK